MRRAFRSSVPPFDFHRVTYFNTPSINPRLFLYVLDRLDSQVLVVCAYQMFCAVLCSASFYLRFRLREFFTGDQYFPGLMLYILDVEHGYFDNHPANHPCSGRPSRPWLLSASGLLSAHDEPVRAAVSSTLNKPSDLFADNKIERHRPACQVSPHSAGSVFLIMPS